jgi:hypothetical protein
VNTKKVLRLVFFVVCLLMFSTLVSAAISDYIPDFSSGLDNKWVVIVVNAALIGLVGFVLTVTIKKDSLSNEQRYALYAGIAVVAFLIAFQVYDGGSEDWLWKIQEVQQFLDLKVIVNVLLVAAALYIVYYMLGIEPTGENKSNVFSVVAIGIILLMAFSIAKPLSDDTADYHFIWEWEGIAPYRFMLIGDAECTFYSTDSTGWDRSANDWEDKEGYNYFYDDSDGNWYINHWFSNEAVTDEGKINTLERVKEIKDINVNELDAESQVQYQNDLTRISSLAGKESRTEKRCYTRQSLNEFMEYLKSDDPNKKYVSTEKKPSLQELRSGGGFGILSGSRFMMMIIGIIVISWAVSAWGFIKVEGANNDRITYVVAFLASAAMAHSAVLSYGSFIWIMQFIAMAGLFKSFAGEWKNSFGTYASLFFSVVLVTSFVEMVFPQYMVPYFGRLTLGGILGAFGSFAQGIFVIGQLFILSYLMFGMGWWKSIWGWGGIIGLIALSWNMFGDWGLNLATLGIMTSNMYQIGGGILLVALLVAATIALWRKGEVADDNVIKLLLSRGIVDALNFGISRIWNKTPIVRSLFPLRELDRPHAMSKVFYENMLLMHYLNTICKRTWIYYGYYSVVKEAEEEVPKYRKDIGVYTDFDKVKLDIVKYRSDPSKLQEEWDKIKETGKTLAPTTADNIKEVSNGHDYFKGGWCSHNQLIAEVYNRFLEICIDLQEAIETNNTDKINNILAEANGPIRTTIENITQLIDNMYHAHEHRIHAFSAHRVIDSLRQGAYDMANPHGFYEHTYRFVRDGAELSDGSNAKMEKRNDRERYLQVDRDGYILDDMRKVVDNWKTPQQIYDGFASEFAEAKKKARKVRNLKDTFWFLPPDNEAETVLRFVDKEWANYLLDMKFGTYHPHSRTALDYINYYDQNEKVIDDHIAAGSGPGGEVGFGNPTFDLRMLNNQGNFHYWGRRALYVSFRNIYVC